MNDLILHVQQLLLQWSFRNYIVSVMIDCAMASKIDHVSFWPRYIIYHYILEVSRIIKLVILQQYV